MRQQRPDSGRWRSWQLSDLAVPADIGFSAAASNAVTTAVNVNSQLSSAIKPLQRAAADVRRVVDELAALTAAVNGDAADAGRAEELARSAAALRSGAGQRDGDRVGRRRRPA